MKTATMSSLNKSYRNRLQCDIFGCNQIMTTINIIPPMSERIYTTNLGTTLLLKTCGFVEDHQAKILDVTENYLKLRIGHTWLERAFFRCSNSKPIEITLAFQAPQLHALSESERMRLPGRECAQIDVTITPHSKAWNNTDFHQYCRRLLWSLRQHFISPQ